MGSALSCERSEPTATITGYAIDLRVIAGLVEPSFALLASA